MTAVGLRSMPKVCVSYISERLRS